MNSRRTAPSLVAVLASALATLMIPGCATTDTAGAATTPVPASTQNVIRGTVAFRERTALPQDAELTMRLVDIANPAKPVVLAESKAPVGGKQAPIPFALPFDRAKVPGNLNALRATITYGGKIQYVTGARIILHPDALPATLALAVIPGDTEPSTGDTGTAGALGGPPPIPGDNSSSRQRQRRQQQQQQQPQPQAQPQKQP